MSKQQHTVSVPADVTDKTDIVQAAFGVHEAEASAQGQKAEGASFDGKQSTANERALDNLKDKISGDK